MGRTDSIGQRKIDTTDAVVSSSTTLRFDSIVITADMDWVY